MQRKLAFIAADVTNHCNARCRFCFNKWPKALCMEREVFHKLIMHGPKFSQGHVYLSCLYEPTLHPSFADYLKLLPAKFRNSFFFTSNLVKKLPESFFETVAESELSHINISLETFQQDRYHKLAGVRNSRFYENLETLARIFRQASNPPGLRFITMILRENAAELVELAQRAHDLYPAQLHEFRTPYPGRPQSAYLAEQGLSREELDALQAELLSLGIPVRMDIRHDQAFYARWADNEPEALPPSLPLRLQDGSSTMAECEPTGTPMGCRVNAAGHIWFDGLKRAFDLAAIDDPDVFFSNILTALGSGLREGRRQSP